MRRLRRLLEGIYYRSRLLLLYLGSRLGLNLYPEPRSRGPVVVYVIGGAKRPLRSEINRVLGGDAWWRVIRVIYLDKLSDRWDIVEPAAPYARLVTTRRGLSRFK